MAEKRENRSSIRSRQFMQRAFIELLKEKRMEKITVTDIVNRADVNRSTFYAHYTDVRGLINEIQQEFIDQSIQLMKDMDFLQLLRDPVPILRGWIHIADRHKDLYTILGKASVETSQIEKFKLLLVEKAMNMPEIPEEIRKQKNFEIRVNFFVGGIINVYQQYLVGNLDATTEEIIADIAALITSSASTILNIQE